MGKAFEVDGTQNGSDECLMDTGLAEKPSHLRRRVVLFLMFGAVCYYKSDDGTLAHIRQGSHKSLKAGKTLRATKRRKCLNCSIAEQSSQLPYMNQIWSHATNSVQKLQQALDDPTITAIEADMLMGHDSFGGSDSPLEPVMCHPPLCSSGLSVKTFFHMATAVPDNNASEQILQHHIKLDFKELRVIEPALTVISSLPIKNPNGKVIFSNADILPQSGARIEANEFFETCLRFLNSTTNTELQFAFSLGYNILDRVLLGFHEVDLSEMAKLMRQYNVTNNSAGVVLSINARLLAKNTLPFDLFLDEFPTVRILAWVGLGEPPISRRDFEKINRHFEQEGRSDRIGFDCHVAKHRFLGFVYDLLIYVVFILFVCLKAFQCCF